jgi:hypothetical protein
MDTMDMIDETSRRTRWAAYAMVLGGLVLTVPTFLAAPNSADDTHERLQDFAANPHPDLAKSLVFQAALLLLLPGFVAWVGRARGRGSVAMFLGAGTALVTMPCAYAFVMLNGVEVSLAGDGPIDPGLVAADDRMTSSPAAFPTYLGALLLFHLIAMPVWSFGLVRSRQVPVWLAAAPAVGMLMAFFGSGSRVESAGWVLLGLALSGLGVALVRPRVAATARTAVPVGA